MKRKKIAGASLVAVFMLALTACGGNETKQEPGFCQLGIFRNR